VAFIHLHDDPDDSLLIQTCRTLRYATHPKTLWLTFLQRLSANDHTRLPQYIKPLATMTSHEVEILTRRIAQMDRDWDRGQVHPKSITRLDLPQSVTWLRLIAGRWLLVASSDSHTSRLCCFDTSRLAESTKPATECFFAGRIQTGDVEVQSDGIVIALGVDHPSVSFSLYFLLLAPTGC
jgi:hypothetical protein